MMRRLLRGRMSESPSEQGTDIAIDAADIVLMKSRLSDVPAAVRMSRAALRNIHEKSFLGIFYNVIGIPLAAESGFLSSGGN